MTPAIQQVLPEGQWFCCKECQKINSALNKLIIRGEEKLPDSFLNVIKKKHVENGPQRTSNLDVRWRVLSGKMASSDARRLLSSAVAILHVSKLYAVNVIISWDFV